MKLQSHFQNLLSGKLYFVDKEELFKKTIGSIQMEYEPTYNLKDGIILSNKPHDNHRIKFDIMGDENYFGCTCIGFIYPDLKFNGKIHWVADANLSAENISGVYKLTKKGISINGKWEDSSGNKSYFWLEMHT